MKLKSLIFALFAGIAVSGTAIAAPVTGVAVQADGSALPNPVVIEDSPLGISNALRYFIPLTSGGTCVFGVDCGTSSDSGTGGTLMSMFLAFTPVTPGVGGTLSILFDDLDLINANDPSNFLEEVTVKSGGTEIISIDTFDGVIVTDTTVPNGPGNPADNITQLVLTLDPSLVAADPLILELVFSASSTGGKNTAEHLLALFDQAGGATPVPLPGALPLFAGGLGLMGLMGWRRKRKTGAA